MIRQIAAESPDSLLIGNGIYRRCGKRMLDAIIAALGLVLASPVMLVVAILVKGSSPGSVFYRQERVGLGGQCFRIIKFRTMRDDADKDGLAITSSTDPRVTSAGRWLRRIKLDELPQLWNVLMGEMSLVGPRPEVPRYVEAYSASQRRILLVRPGITDPASIAYRHEEELLGCHGDSDRFYREVVMPDKLNMNLEYLRRISFRYDLLLLVRTTSAIVTPFRISKTK
jgi:lipopolysaccharide/colanic/teichoic acid biosynthesis glycosyltransferase